ncbi:hypothetical protein V1504DRAFT_461236 [Lipomyces starkeyi]
MLRKSHGFYWKDPSHKALFRRQIRQGPKISYPHGSTDYGEMLSWLTFQTARHMQDLNEWPAVKKWEDRISAAEAVQRGVNVPPASRRLQEIEKLWVNWNRKAASMNNTN